MGQRLPRRRLGAHRPGLRQGPAAAPDPRVVHAPQRPAAGLRVGLRGRRPARAGMGGPARLPDRAPHDGPRRPPVPRAHLPQAAARLHVVGQPQGPRRPQRLRRRLPGPRQHRRLRPRRGPARRQLAGPVGRHRVDGHVLPLDAGDRLRAGRPRPGLRGPGHQVLRALPLRRGGPQRPGRAGRGDVGRGRRVLLRRPADARRHGHAPQGALARGPHPAARGGHPGGPPAGAPARLPPAHAVVPAPPPGPGGPGGQLGRAGRRRAPPALARPRPSHEADPEPHAGPAGVPQRPRHPLAEPLAPGPPLPGDAGRARAGGALRAGAVPVGPLRWQLELARPGVVPRELPLHRGAPAAPPLLRGRLPGRVPDGLGRAPLARRGGRCPVAASRGALPARLGRPASGARRRAAVRQRPGLARPHPLLRVLRRRHGRRAGGQPPDRLDGPRGQAHRADRPPGGGRASFGRRGPSDPTRACRPGRGVGRAATRAPSAASRP